MTQYEIFTLEADGITKNGNIDTLFGYPNATTKTDQYRILIKKYDENLWAGVVDTTLTDACSAMTPTDRANYYDDSDLKNDQYLIVNNWFPPE